MQIKTEKDKIPLKRTVFSFLLLMLIYGALAFGLSLWMYGESWSEAGLVRWVNLLLVPVAGTLLLVRSARSARIYFTHLTQKDMIQQRLTDSLIRDGYRISESLPHQVYFRSEFPLLSSISSRAPLWMEFEEDYILLHGPWNKIHELERQAHEGEIFLPKSR